MLKNINDFYVVRNDCLPSDHAPVSLMINLPDGDMEHLVRRDSQLADHAVLHEYKTKRTKTGKRPVQLKSVDTQMFLRHLAAEELPNVSVADIDGCIEHVSKVLYDCSSNAKRIIHTEGFDVNQDRW